MKSEVHVVTQKLFCYKWKNYLQMYLRKETPII